MTAAERVRVDSETNLRDSLSELAKGGTCAIVLDEAGQVKAAVVDLKEQLKRQKKAKVGKLKLDSLIAEIKVKEKAARDLEVKAADIDAAVFDLKAVNPNVVVKVDTRTPQEIISNIEEHGRIITEALNNLHALLAETDCTDLYTET